VLVFAVVVMDRLEGRDFWEDAPDLEGQLERARHDDPFTRWAAAVELAESDEPTANAVLRELLADRDELVRQAAAAALSRHGDDSSTSPGAARAGGRGKPRRSSQGRIEEAAAPWSRAAEVEFPVHRVWKRYRKHLLSKQEEQRFFTQVQLSRAGPADVEQFVQHNLGLALLGASKLAPSSFSASYEFMDAVQDGLVGLLRAVEGFDHTLGNKFSTYALWWVFQRVRRGSTDVARTIRLPVHVWEQVLSIERTHRELEARGQPIGVADIAAKLGDSELSVRSALRASRISQVPLCLEEALRDLANPNRDADNEVASDSAWLPADCDDLYWCLKRWRQPDDIEFEEHLWTEDMGSWSLGEIIEDESGEDAIDAVERSTRADLDAALLALTKRERKVMRLRYGLDGENLTLEAVGQRLGVTRERVRQIQAKALDKLATIMTRLSATPLTQSLSAETATESARTPRGPARTEAPKQTHNTSQPVSSRKAARKALRPPEDANRPARDHNAGWQEDRRPAGAVLIPMDWYEMASVAELSTHHRHAVLRLKSLAEPRFVTDGSFGEVLTQLRLVERQLVDRRVDFAHVELDAALAMPVLSCDIPLVIAAQGLLEAATCGLRLPDLFESISVVTLGAAGVATPQELAARLEACAGFAISPDGIVALGESGAHCQGSSPSTVAGQTYRLMPPRP
jgi:RNA polymerase sigma factor, sigma-70 family